MGKNQEKEERESGTSLTRFSLFEKGNKKCMREGRCAVVKQKRVMWNGVGIGAISGCLYPSNSSIPSSKDFPLMVGLLTPFCSSLNSRQLFCLFPNYLFLHFPCPYLIFSVFFCSGCWKTQLPSQFSLGLGRQLGVRLSRLVLIWLRAARRDLKMSGKALLSSWSLGPISVQVLCLAGR